MKNTFLTLFLLVFALQAYSAERGEKPPVEKVGDPPLQDRLEALVQAGKYEAARALLLRTREQWPAQSWHGNMGAVLIRAGELEAAARELEAALEADAVTAAIWHMLKGVRSYQARAAYKSLFPQAAAPQPISITLFKPAQREGVPGWREQVLAALDRWRRAWSAQNVDAYLALYVPGYRPAGGLSHEAWLRQRRERLHRPAWIDVQVRNIRLEQLRPGQVRVRFEQTYASNLFRDTVRKQIDWVRTDQGWRIEREVVVR